MSIPETAFLLHSCAAHHSRACNPGVDPQSERCLTGRNEARRRRGYGVRGQRVRLSDPFYDDKNFTLLAACNLNGFVVPACYVAEEKIDTTAFVAWVRHHLCPCLGDFARGEPNSVLVLDNVNQHWSSEALDLIRERGTQVIFLPPYSPEVGLSPRALDLLPPRAKADPLCTRSAVQSD